jgi:hypothetical protein
MEAIYHFLGLCGEHNHPNIFHVLLFGVVAFFSYISVKNRLTVKK